MQFCKNLCRNFSIYKLSSKSLIFFSVFLFQWTFVKTHVLSNKILSSQGWWPIPSDIPSARQDTLWTSGRHRSAEEREERKTQVIPRWEQNYHVMGTAIIWSCVLKKNKENASKSRCGHIVITGHYQGVSCQFIRLKNVKLLIWNKVKTFAHVDFSTPQSNLHVKPYLCSDNIAFGQSSSG